MNYLRKMDELCHSLSSMQARIFERSVENGIPSYFFIKSFMLSKDASDLDNLYLEKAGITEQEIYANIASKITINRGIILPYNIIHFIGYFYRSAAYLLNVSSKFLLNNIPPKFLVNNYPTLHSLKIEDAIKESIDANGIKLKSLEELFVEAYKRL